MTETNKRIDKVIVFQTNEKREYAFLIGKINRRGDLSSYLEGNHERVFDCLMDSVGADETCKVNVEVDKEHIGDLAVNESCFVGLDTVISKKHYKDEGGEDSIFVKGRLVCINEEKVIDVLLRTKVSETLN